MSKKTKQIIMILVLLLVFAAIPAVTLIGYMVWFWLRVQNIYDSTQDVMQP